ncbi:unnamed protein product [Caenorhabditis auriculariae]|uniref:Mitochondrial fission 1 protein n=1 Tax=Caenorhabditis auriculariae TaxID=2777116 RepID=A0A8S1H5P5_9PELO|nr:unnamed protein product [Caenorhabditis auriculariae]
MDYVNILDERIDPIDIHNAREAYAKQAARGEPSIAAKFSFAHALIGSKIKREVHDGIQMLECLLKEDSNDGSNRDYVYYLAVANARLKNFDRALSYIEVLVNAESHNRQAMSLKKAIETKMRNDGLLGAAIIGGGAVIVGGIVAALLAGRK